MRARGPTGGYHSRWTAADRRRKGIERLNLDARFRTVGTSLVAAWLLSACTILPPGPSPTPSAPPPTAPAAVPTAAPAAPAASPTAIVLDQPTAVRTVAPSIAAPPTATPTTAASPSPSPIAVAPTPTPQPGDLPLRPTGQAIQSYNRAQAGARARTPESDLEAILKTPLSDSPVGFVNAHHLLPSESRELSHFSFALNPLYNEAADGRQQFLVFGNSPNFLNYRGGDLGALLLDNSDRAVWAVNSGYRVVTLIQLDNDIGDDLLRYIVKSRAAAGFRVFVVGNEINDPGAPWRYNFPRILRAAQVVRDTLQDMKVRGGVVYTPSLAYFESDTYLDNFLDYAEANYKKIPTDGVSINFYGAVGDVRDYVEKVYGVLKQHKLDGLKLRIGELGNPTDSVQGQPFTDEQLTYNYLPQAIGLAVSSEQVDHLDVFSLFAFGADKFSLATLDGSTLTPKTSYQSAAIAARALARLRDIDYKEDGDVRRIVLTRDDGLRIWMLWSASDTRELRVKKPDKAQVFGALGNRLDEDEIVLTPRPHPALAGTIKYVLLGK